MQPGAGTLRSNYLPFEAGEESPREARICASADRLRRGILYRQSRPRPSLRSG